jgi:hypothetical protein
VKFVVKSYCKKLWLMPANGRIEEETEEETDSHILGFNSTLKDWTGSLLVFIGKGPRLVMGSFHLKGFLPSYQERQENDAHRELQLNIPQSHGGPSLLPPCTLQW